jgi:UDP-N-acetylglucosamine--N-acetylmuramyl-(pentapeptide) pyrophosphoryl-undecaprenol N-acetylglucosamine transferase
MKRLLTVGGGSGGHVTPIVSVIQEIQNSHPDIEIRFWCDKRFYHQAVKIMHSYDNSIPIRVISSGKYRRYHHLSAVQHLITPSVIFPNIIDFFKVMIGIVQSLFLLIFWRPDVVFAKGGFVCLPVGIASWILRVPLVIHDSDAIPGLTNKILAPIASRIATGVPLEHYNYPMRKAVYVGIPIDPSYKKASYRDQQLLKSKLGFDTQRPLVVVSGGGLGARSINDAMVQQLKSILTVANVLLISGMAQYDELRSLSPVADKRFKLVDFLPGLADAFRAADIVVTRAGATTLLELAALEKPTILIPNKRLKWQVEHAQLFVDAEAVVLLDEDNFRLAGDLTISSAVSNILQSEKKQKALENNIKKFARPKAASDLAKIISIAAKK